MKIFINLIVTSILNLLVQTVNGQDVIVKKNGLLIQANVKEIGLDIVKYKKASDPKGPLYSIYRENVYAIMHDNGDKDYFSKPDKSTFVSVDKKSEPEEKGILNKVSSDSYLFKKFYVSVGAGVMESYTEVGNSDDFSNRSQNFPNIHIRGFTSIDKGFDAGVQLSFGTYKFDETDGSNYDETVIANNISERVISTLLIGRYTLNSESVKPYGILGIGFNRSRIDSEINLVVADDNAVVVNSSNVIYNAAFLARAGAKLKILEQASLYSDIGTGINLLQFGVEWNIK